MNPLTPLFLLADRLRYRLHGNSGKRGEDVAHRYLRRHGFVVVARNWRPPQGHGEIDIIAREPSPEGDVLVFVEVKFRTSGEFSSPERAVDGEKITALRRAARDYIRRSGANPDAVRFDVLAITGAKFEHLRDAFHPLF